MEVILGVVLVVLFVDLRNVFQVKFGKNKKKNNNKKEHYKHFWRKLGLQENK